jgi:hypothetical protein
MNIALRAVQGGALLGLGAVTTTATIGVFLAPSVLAAVALGAAASLGAGLLAATLHRALQARNESVGDFLKSFRDSPQLQITATAFALAAGFALISVMLALTVKLSLRVNPNWQEGIKFILPGMSAVLSLHALATWNNEKTDSVQAFLERWRDRLDKG